MPDDQKTTQNQDFEKNYMPPSPQEPTKPATLNTAHSEPSVAHPEAPESSPDGFPSKSNDTLPSNSTPTEVVNEPKTEGKQASSDAEALADRQNEPIPKPVSLPIEAPKSETAQITGNEPLPVSAESSGEAKEEIKLEPEPEKEKPGVAYIKSQKLGELLVLARNAIQFRKRKKLDRIMSLFLKQSKITNDEVEKFLHISDATATRYLSQLEKEGRIKQSGKTGKGVSYYRM